MSASQARTNILGEYVMLAPRPQNALDIFKAEWTSKLPGELASLSAGSMRLFEDPRIKWFVDQLGGIQGQNVLELGPLEAGHTYMLEHLGAASVLSIEANTRAYLKCLIIKELLELKRARFLCGDFVEYLRTNQEKFDVCLACGVLYHMVNPVELIALLAKATDRVCLWTHYYDEELLSETPRLAQQFSHSESAEYAGFQHTLYHRAYEKEDLDWRGFCGGGKPSSCWMSREDILMSVEYFGLTEVEIGFDDPNHQNGPSFALTAFRK